MKLVERVDRLMTRDRLIVYPIVVLIAFSATVLVPWLSGSAHLLPDFVARWTAGRLVVQGNGHSLYDPAVQAAVQSAELGVSDSLSLFVSPPFVALICAPLGFLPYGLAALVWTALSAGALALSFRILAAEFSTPASPWNRRGAFLAAIASYPVIELFGGGQDSAFVLLGAVSCLRLLNRNSPGLAGMTLASTLIKPQLVFLLPVVLLAKGHTRALITLAMTSSAIFAVTTAILGFAQWSEWLRLVFSEGYGSAVHEGQAWKSASLTGFIGSVAGSGDLWIGVAVLLAVGSTIVTWLLVGRPYTPLSLAWGWAMAAGVVTSPHAMIYDVVLLLALVFALTTVAWTARTRVLLLAWTLAMFLVAPLFAVRSALEMPQLVSAPWHVPIACALACVLARAMWLRSLEPAER